MAKILVTGGAGYIGSHTCVELLDAGHEVIVLDNLSNSSEESLTRVKALTSKNLVFVRGDILDQQVLDQIFAAHAIDAVIHFAGLKAVGESQQIPLAYFDNNIAGTISLAKAMERAGVFKLVFSSSATVYDEANISPLNEDMPTGMPSNNYGYTKLIAEQLLQKLAAADARWSIALLRYFNPVGAHKSGCMGEDPQGVPNNLMPYVTQVAVGRREKLAIFGNDYATPDGTGVRDYIHVADLANAHLCALNNRLENTGCRAWNIGTGKGSSVLEVVKTFEQVNGMPVRYAFSPRREGDVATSFADNARAVAELGWQPKYSLEDMLADSWNWQKRNPNGYRK